MKIAVCLPSRGLIHSRTFEAVWKNVNRIRLLRDTEVELFFSHDNKIPDCFNVIAEEALLWGADFVWFVEEDMVPPEMGLVTLLSSPGDVRGHDYPIAHNNQPVTVYKDGEAIFTGMGSLLIPAYILQKTLPFRADVAYVIEDGEYIRKDWPVGYGGQDVHFFMQLRELGYSLTIAGEADHLRVYKYGMGDTNNGCHEIASIDKT